MMFDSDDNVSSTMAAEGFPLVHTTSEKVEMAYQMIFFLCGTPINMFAFWRQYRMQRHNAGTESRLIKLSLHLIVANLWVLCIYCVWRTYWFMNIIWTDGDAMCRLYSVATTFPFHLWSNMVAAIAFDMLCCITSPLASYRTGSNRVNWLIAIAWTVAVLCSLPMAVFRGSVAINVSDNYTQTELYQCYPNINYFSQTVLNGFNFFHVITTFYVPLLIVIVCYTIIGVSLRRQMKERRRLMQTGNGKSTADTSKSAKVSTSSAVPSLTSRADSGNRLAAKIPLIKLENCMTPPRSCPGSRRTSGMSSIGDDDIGNDHLQSIGSLARRISEVRCTHRRSPGPSQQSKTKNRFLRVTVGIIATFVLTWLPYQVLALLRVLCDADTPCSNIAERLNWLQAAIIASACINPFLYRFRTRPPAGASTLNTMADRTSSFKDYQCQAGHQQRGRMMGTERRLKPGYSSTNLCSTTNLRTIRENNLLMADEGPKRKRSASISTIPTFGFFGRDTSNGHCDQL